MVYTELPGNDPIVKNWDIINWINYYSRKEGDETEKLIIKECDLLKIFSISS